MLHIIVAMVLAIDAASAQQKTVEKSGQHSKLKLEQVLAGHLQELNGKYKLRVTEVTYDSGGFIGAHHHSGPGIRCIISGELSCEQPGRTTILQSG